MASELEPATRSAVGSVRQEGVRPSMMAVELADRVAAGDLTGDEAAATVIERHGLVAPAR